MNPHHVMRWVLVPAGLAAGWLLAGRTGGRDAGEARTEAAQNTASALPGQKAERQALVAGLFTAAKEAHGAGAQIAAALALADALEPGEFHDAMSRTLQLPANSAMTLFTSAAVLRWTRSDPAAAAKWCAGNAANLIPDVVRLWAGRDANGAAEFMAGLPEGLRLGASAGYAEALAATDAAKALAFLAEPENHSAGEAALKHMAAHDAHGLLEKAETLPASIRAQARNAAIEALGRTDFSAAVAWAQQQPDRTALLRRVLETQPDARILLDAVTRLPESAHQELSGIDFGKLARRDPEGVVAELQQSPGVPASLRQAMLNAAVPALLAENPAAAVQRLQKAFPELASGWARQAAAAWWAVDARAAEEWADGLPEAEHAQAKLALTQAGNARAVESAGNAWERTKAIMDTSQYLSPGDVFLLSTEQREQFLNEYTSPGAEIYAATVIRQNYPHEYARWLAAQRNAPGYQEALVQFAGSWAQEEPSAASDWVLSLPEGREREAAVREVASQWETIDPRAAKAWAGALPSAGDDR